MKTSNKKRILAFVMALALLVTGVWNNEKFVSRAAGESIALDFEGYYESSYFCFTVDALPADVATYYIADGIVVDEEIKNELKFTVSHGKILIESWFGGANVPTTSIKIPAGTKLTEFATSPWGPVANGKTLTISNELSLVKENDVWKKVVKENVTSLTFEGHYDNVFYFVPNALPADAPTYYVADGVVVDNAIKDGLKFTVSDGKMLIEPWFGGANVPTTNIKIPAGTKLTEFITEPWGPVANGKTLTISNELSLVKEDGTWKVQTVQEPSFDKDVALRFVVASDMHIADTNSNDSRVKYFKQMFETAYKYAEKDKNHATIDAFVMVGDIVNTGENTEYASLKTLIESANTKNTPILTVNGNHEWWGDKSADKVAEKKQNYINGMAAIDSVATKDMNWSTEINGYTFIGMAQESNDTFSTDTLNWMSGQVESAIEQDSTKPVFTLQHLAPNNTVYGSKTNAGWDANGVLNNVYDGHQQVINFSGHSHAPINTPTAINQTTYTQYTTGTLYYMELDGSASYGAQPAGTNPTAEYTIVEVYGDNTVKMFPYDELDNKNTFFKKLDGSGDQLVYEIDVNDKANWKYTSARKTNNPAPAFAENAAITVSKQTYKSATITFPQASDDTGVYAYDITCTPNDGGTAKNYRIFSEWYFSDMKSELSYTIPGLEAGKTYTVSVVPVDFFDATGNAITGEIKTSSEVGEFTFSLLTQNDETEFCLKASNPDDMMGTYYRIPVVVDGVKETYIAGSKNAEGYLAVWPNFLKACDSSVEITSSIEIKAGAVLQEVSSVAWNTVLANGDSITVSEDLKLLKGTDGKYTEAGKTYKTVLSLKAAGTTQVQLTSSCDALTTYDWPGKSLKSTVLIDGVEKEVIWTIDKGMIWTAASNLISDSVQMVVIPKGTLLTPTAGTVTEPMELTETFCLANANGTWVECYNTTLSLKAAGTLQVQLFSSCDALITYGWAGRALKSTALVDDVATEVTWTIDEGMIWTAASNLISDSTQKIVIPAGTLMTPTAGNNKRPLYVTEDFALVRSASDDSWFDEKSIIDVTYNKLEAVRDEAGALDISITSEWKGEEASYSGTVWVDGVKKTGAVFWMNQQGSTWHSIAEDLKTDIKAHKTIKIAKGTIFTCSGKAPMRLNAEKDLVFKWDGTTYVEGIKEETVEGKFSAVQSNQVQFYSTANFGSEIADWETVKNAITIKVNGVETTANVCYGEYKEGNTASYFWLQGSAVADAITKGATITLPTSATVYFANEKVTFNFAENMAIVKLGQGGAMYTSEYTYPNGDNKFYYNIDNGTSYKLTSSNNAISVEGYPDLTTGSTIDKVGAYNVTRIENEVLYKQVVVLYKHGDANEDDKISAVDLIAMKKVAADSNAQPTRLAGTYAADINRDGKVNDDDLTALRKALVSADAAAELKVAKGNSVLNGVMPIVGFGVFDLEGKTTDELYSLVSDLGINAVSFNNKEYSTSSMAAGTLAHLQSAEKKGIGIYVQDNHLHQGKDFLEATSLEEKIALMAKRVALYSTYKSFLGTYLIDEAETKDYYSTETTDDQKDKKAIDKYKDDIAMMKQFTNLNTYVNLLPYYSSKDSLNATVDGYNAYLNDTFKQYDLDMLSYDNYPVGKGKIIFSISKKEVGYEDFYTNLRLARAAAQEKGTPFWAFAQVGLYANGDKNNVKIDSKYLPTKADQQWEISASLACGAKGIQYFQVVGTSEWTASGKDTDRAGLIKADGTKNNAYGYYDAAKETNTFVAAVDHVLMNADNKGVIAKDTNAQGPLTGMLLPDYNEVTSVAGENALVGCFDYYGKTALLVVNCDTSSSQEITLNFNGNQKFEVTNYAGVTTASEGTTFKSTIGAGQCSLVVLQ